jgi:hypothetical protein
MGSLSHAGGATFAGRSSMLHGRNHRGPPQTRAATAMHLRHRACHLRHRACYVNSVFFGFS